MGYSVDDKCRKLAKNPEAAAIISERAAGFYEHMGFQRLPEYEEDGLVFGMHF